MEAILVIAVVALLVTIGFVLFERGPVARRRSVVGRPVERVVERPVERVVERPTTRVVEEEPRVTERRIVD